MVTLLGTLAWAAPLDGLPPLPACDADSGPQLVLPMRVLGLWFDGEGDLWVADWAGLTRHDGDTLETLERLHPGTHGWAGIEVDGADVYVENALGPSWRLEGNATPWRGSSELYQLFQGLGRRLDDDVGAGIVPPPVAPFGPAELPEWGVAREMLTGVSHIRPAIRSAVARRDADGTVAVATIEGLHLYGPAQSAVRSPGPDHALKASRPIVWSTEASGLVRDRLFTVSGGVLRIWSGDGERWWEAPGVWSGAVALGDDLVLADLRGRLWTLDLDVGRPKARACVTGSCAPIELPGGAPVDGEADVLGPLALGWAEGLQAWLDAHPPAPLALAVVDGEIVAGELDPAVWAMSGIERVTALHRIHPSAKRIVASRELEVPAVGSPTASGPGRIQIGDQAFLLADLAPVGSVPAPDGPHVQVEWSERQREGGTQVTVGAVRAGVFEPAPGLPPRLVTQVRGHPRAVIAGDRFVVTGVSGSEGMKGTLPPGSTEVWCVPDQDGPPATIRPGVLAEPRFGEHGGGDPATRADQIGRLPPRRVVMGARQPSLDEASADGPVFVLQLGAPTLPPVVADLLPLGLPVRVHSAGPAPSGLPAGVTWLDAGRPILPVGSLSLVSHGIVVWTGSPEAFHPEILAGHPGGTPDADLVKRWQEGPGRVHAGATRPGDEALRAALHAEDWAAVRELQQGSGVRLDADQIARAWTGAPLPDGIRWERAPAGDRWLLAVDAIRQELVWDASDALDIPAALLWTRPPAKVHPGLATGVWEGSGKWPVPGLLAVEGGVIRAILPRDASVDTIRAALP